MSSECISWGKRLARQYYIDHNLIIANKENLGLRVKYVYFSKWKQHTKMRMFKTIKLYKLKIMYNW